MKPIFIKHRSETKKRKGYLLDANHVIYSDGVFVAMFEAVPTEEPETYTEAYDYAHIIVAKGGRTQATMEEIVHKLYTMPAYTLLTEHYDKRDECFFINKQVKHLGRFLNETP